MATKPIRRNPVRIFGESLSDYAYGGIGLFATVLVNDKIIFPILSKFVPGLTSGTVGNLMNAGTTAASAMLAGKAIGMVSRPGGEVTQLAGSALAGARALGMVVPGLSINANVPWGGFSMLAPASGNGKKALPEATEATDVPSAAAIGVGTTGL